MRPGRPRKYHDDFTLEDRLVSRVRRGLSFDGVRFTLGGYHGMAPFVEGFPRSHPISCSTGWLLTGADWQPAIQSGSIRYDEARSRYTWKWVTTAASSSRPAPPSTP